MQYVEPSLEELKRLVPILPLAALHGKIPKRVGKGEYVVLCPFHEEKTPSCHINNHKNVFNCKGCGKGGTVLDWVMQTRKLNMVSAIDYLKNEYGRIQKVKQYIANEEKQEAPAPVNILEPHIQKALALLVDYYHNNFKAKKEGAAFLLKRGIIFGELVDDFKIGLSDGSLVSAVNDPEILQTLIELGILKVGETSTNGNGSLREHFAGRVIFPVIDENGLIVQIYGRNLSAIGSKHMLLAGASLSLFNPRALIAGEVILCESIIDALSIMAMGHRNVVASLSANGLKDDLLDKIVSGGVRRVYVAFDNDNAGNTSASSLAEKLIQKKIESYRIVFDENSDANDLLRKSENIDSAKGKMAELLEKAVPLKQVIDTVQTAGYHTDVLEKRGKEYLYKIGPREYTIRGLDQNKSDSSLKIFLRLDYTEPLKHEKRFHIDTVDLFNAKTAGIYARAAATKLTLDERVISSELDSLTVKLDELLKKSIEDKESQKTEKKKEFHKNLELSFKAREFLADPLFITKFVKDMEKAGVVGEPLNMFFGFLSTLSRYMKYPLHLIIQSESSSGKSNMLNLLSKLVPEEDMIYLTQVTPRSFYYGEPDFLKNKSIFIAEADGLKEAEYAIKQLMSELRLAISSTKTDPKTGEHTSDSREIEGPAQFIITEPVESLIEEIINRCVTLILDMSLAQTERIMDFQRLSHSPEGVLLRRQKEIICDFYRHVQREIQALEVINPFSSYLSFNATTHQARRDHQKYLTLINTITLMNQHQREKIYKDGKLCVKTHPIDIAQANFLARYIFANSLEEMSPQTMLFMKDLVKYVSEQAGEKQIEFDHFWFYRKDARKLTGLSNTRVHEHINRMVDHEILTTRRDQNGFAYRFLLKPDEQAKGVAGLDRLKLVRMAEILSLCANWVWLR